MRPMRPRTHRTDRTMHPVPKRYHGWGKGDALWTQSHLAIVNSYEARPKRCRKPPVSFQALARRTLGWMRVTAVEALPPLDTGIAVRIGTVEFENAGYPTSKGVGSRDQQGTHRQGRRRTSSCAPFRRSQGNLRCAECRVAQHRRDGLRMGRRRRGGRIGGQPNTGAEVILAAGMRGDALRAGRWFVEVPEYRERWPQFGQSNRANTRHGDLQGPGSASRAHP